MGQKKKAERMTKIFVFKNIWLMSKCPLHLQAEGLYRFNNKKEPIITKDKNKKKLRIKDGNGDVCWKEVPFFLFLFYNLYELLVCKQELDCNKKDEARHTEGNRFLKRGRIEIFKFIIFFYFLKKKGYVNLFKKKKRNVIIRTVFWSFGKLVSVFTNKMGSCQIPEKYFSGTLICILKLLSILFFKDKR